MPASPPRELPRPLRPLGALALDLRWTWSHEADALWERVDLEAWERTHNPWVVLQDVPAERLRALAQDAQFVAEIERLSEARRAYLASPAWFAAAHGCAALGGVAYFSMEFGLGAALPFYAGGLGVLAGDFLKAASDLGLPVTGIGLLYQEGYFRQVVDAEGRQHEAYPYNDPGTMPIEPVRDRHGARLHVHLDLPGRRLLLRIWRARVGRVRLYLLDANDPLNAAADRGITARLYDAGSEARLLQEIVLGVAGWRAVEALAPEVEICHLNEGHAAFVVLERARSAMRRAGLDFTAALWATRPGNVFTTHTPVAAGFDSFGTELVERYAHYLEPFLAETGLTLGELLALGRARPADAREPFGMAWLAMRGCLRSFGVSRVHGRVSRPIFQPLYPRWPQAEVPIEHVTNGVHVPSWDSRFADQLWTRACGKERWRGMPDELAGPICDIADEQLWAMRGAARAALIAAVRGRLARQLVGRGLPRDAVADAQEAMHPGVLTIGFARRFTAYKRNNLLLRDLPRFARLLRDPGRPVQLVLAGKAHPADMAGKEMVAEWLALSQRPEWRRHLVFLEDYDIALAQELVQGVDLWINTPQPLSEACGTSGMKVLVNGGLNLSVRDGWWAEAYRPELGWAIGDGESGEDGNDAEALYAVLERDIVPEFYDRDAAGLPRRWLARVRASMASLTPVYSTGRMARDYLERFYLPGAAELRRRAADGAAAARAMALWEARLRQRWPGLRIGEPEISSDGGQWQFRVPVALAGIGAEEIAVQLYADPLPPDEAPFVRDLAPPGAGRRYQGAAPMTRPAQDYTVRIVPRREGVRVPAELPLILWQK